MKRSAFNDICQGIIRPIGDAVAMQSFRALEGLGSIVFAADWERGLYDAYEGWRFVAHDLMRDKSMLIDRHKIAASIALAILEYNPLQTHYTNEDGKFLTLFRVANEFLAFNAGMAIIVEFAIADATRKADRALADALQGSVVFPPSSVASSSYRAQTYRALYHLRRLESRYENGGEATRGKAFAESFLILSNLFFVLEKYNLQSKLSQPIIG